MLEPVERRIGPHLYRVVPLGCKANTAALEEVLRVVAPGLGGAGAFVHAETVLEAAMMGGFGALSNLCAGLPPGALWDLVEKFGKGAKVHIDDEGEDKGFRDPRLLDVADDLWAGERYADMFHWLGFALEVNYASFFDASGSATELLKKARAAVKAIVPADEQGEQGERSASPSPSPSASTG